MRHVVVLGGGITGLAAAYTLTQAGGDALHVTIIEADKRIGGKIRTRSFAGVSVDLGPEAFVARGPEVRAMCRALGLEEALSAPVASKTYVWTRGRLRSLPEGLVYGIPTTPWAIVRSGLLSPVGIARAGLDMLLPRSSLPPDPSITQVIGPRLGREVVERLVEPLLGGIHAGRADRLSLASVAPHLAAAARQHRSLMLGLRSARPLREAKTAPMLLSITGGLERLVDRLRDALHDVDIRTGTCATAISLLPDGSYQVFLDQAAPIIADAIILATPSWATARIIQDIAPEISSRLDHISYASVVTVLLAYSASAFTRPAEDSGFLVPRVDGHLLTACTFCTNKWPHAHSTEKIIVRCSAGRFGDERALQFDDESLVDHLHSELACALGIRERPQERLVTRWERALPQYETGHQARVTEIETALARWPGLVLAGASYHGVGISSCIQDGVQAAQRAQTYLATMRQSVP